MSGSGPGFVAAASDDRPLPARLRSAGDHSRLRRRAFTLMEMLVSLIVVALLAGSMAAMLYAAGYGTDSRRDLRRMAVRVQQLRTRMDTAIRTAQEILATDQSSYVLLWRGDENNTGANRNAINLSELHLIEVVSGVLTSFTVPAPATDTIYTHGQDMRTAIKSAPGRVLRPWGTGISAVSFRADSTDLTQARMLTWRMTLADRKFSEALIGTTTLRAAAAGG